MLSQDPRQADFVLGTCPHCQKVVRIPVTAVTSQSSSQVGCPICSKSFELASVLEEMIPAVKVVDEVPETDVAKPEQPKPKKINAIDTPEIFHNIPKEDYEPITEKKNGRFVVPDLLSRGIDKKSKKKRKRRRRSSSDPDVAKSLAKLRENTSSTSLDQSKSYESSESEEGQQHQDSGSSKRKSRKKVRMRKKSSSSQNTVSRVRKPEGLFKSIIGMPRRLKRTFQKNLTSDAESDSTSADIIMLVLGAMIAIPLLHLILWWFVGIDPIGLAGPTSRIVPFAVPADMHAPTDAGTPIPVEPSKQTTIDDDSFFESDAGPSQSSDGKLPKPTLDPSSVRADDID